GRFLPRGYVVHSWESGTGRLLRTETVRDRWQRVGSWDLPADHEMTTATDAGLSVRRFTLSKHELARKETSSPNSEIRPAGTALDRYIRKPDATYGWNVVHTVNSEGMTQFIIDLKSQTWRTTKDVDRPVWQHWLVIVKPEKQASKTAFLYIGGGANGGAPP